MVWNARRRQGHLITNIPADWDLFSEMLHETSSEEVLTYFCTNIKMGIGNDTQKNKTRRLETCQKRFTLSPKSSWPKVRLRWMFCIHLIYFAYLWWGWGERAGSTVMSKNSQNLSSTYSSSSSRSFSKAAITFFFSPAGSWSAPWYYLIKLH